VDYSWKEMRDLQEILDDAVDPFQLVEGVRGQAAAGARAAGACATSQRERGKGCVWFAVWNCCRVRCAGDTIVTCSSSIAARCVGCTQKKPRKRPTNTYLLLASNALSTLTPLPKVIDMFFMNPEKLQWLDVSNNNLTSIEPVLLQFANLMMLYMHGNQVRACVCLSARLPLAASITHHTTVRARRVTPQPAGYPIRSQTGGSQRTASPLSWLGACWQSRQRACRLHPLPGFGGLLDGGSLTQRGRPTAVADHVASRDQQIGQADQAEEAHLPRYAQLSPSTHLMSRRVPSEPDQAGCIGSGVGAYMCVQATPSRKSPTTGCTA
jgi:hypothetical protein